MPAEQDRLGNGIDSLTAGVGQNGLMIAVGATNFVASAANSSTAQLGAGATFTGTIESIFNQQAISVLLTTDLVGTLTLNQYIDKAGTRKISSWTFAIAAGVPFSRCFVGNGNFFNLTFTNTAGTTTTLNIDTAYGTLPNATNLGNNNVALNEVNGTALSLGQTTKAASIPVVLASDYSTLGAALTTGDSGAKIATGNGANITNTTAKGVQVNILVGTVSGTTPTAVFKLQGSVDGGTNFFDIPGAVTASIVATGNYGITVYPGIAVLAGTTTSGTTATANGVMPGTWRVVWTIGGTTPSFTITGIQYQNLAN